MAGKKVLVLGGGIIGAAIAWNLQRQGADVLILDQGAARATDGSFGWINASFYLSPAHYALRAEGIAAMRRLGDAHGAPVQWCGSLSWEMSAADIDSTVAEFRQLGGRVDVLSADAARALEPALGPLPEHVLHYPSEAVVDAGALAQWFRQGATAMGARCLSGVLARALEWRGGRIGGVRTEFGIIEADHVVVALGTGTQAFLAGAQIHVPLVPRPAVMVRSAPVDFALNHVLATEFGEVRQLADGSLMTPAAITHQADAAERLDTAPLDAAEAAIARLRTLFPGPQITLAEAHVAYRPMPEDGLPVMGPVGDGLYVAVMHSGITLGALAGELGAREVMEGESQDTSGWLASFRPGRFAGKV